MKVVLSGYFGFDNVGDEAILQAMIHSLKRENEDIEITVLSNQPEKTAKTYGVRAINRWKIKEIMQALRQSDGLISGGGSLFQDETGPRSVIYYSGVMLLARLLRKPFAVYAQGMGPLHSQRNRKFTAFALNKAACISVRDEDSQQLLSSIGVKKEATIVPDPVMAFRPETFTSPWLEEQSWTRPVLTVSVREWPGSDVFLPEIAKVLDHYEETGWDIVLVPMHGKEDHVASDKVVTAMTKEATIAPYDASIEEKVKIIAESDLLLGMRLHSLIFAATGHTPFYALSYDPKIDAFAAQAGQPVVGDVNEGIDADRLLKRMTESEENQDDSTEAIRQFDQEAKERVHETTNKVIQSLIS